MSDTIVRIERAVMACLQPMTGTRATGFALVKATGADVELPANSYAIPIPKSTAGNGQLDWRAMVKTSSAMPGANPPTPTVVTQAGVLVPITSVLGGKAQNLDPGTRLRWDPPVIGVEEVSVVDGNGTTGGTAPNGPESVQRIVSVDGVGPRDVGVAAFKALVGNFPAIMISWDSADPVQKRGVGRTAQIHNFTLYAFVDRFDGTSPRRDEGKRIIDEAWRTLIDRADVDGEVFAAPPVIGGQSGRVIADASAMVFFFRFEVPYTTTRIERRVYADWSRTRETIITTDDGVIQPPDPPLTIVDQTQDMP